MKKIMRSLMPGMILLIFAACPAPDSAIETETDSDIVTKTENFNANATYYIAANGEDKPENGAEEMPFKTLKYAVEHLPVSGGYQIIVKDGSYDSFGYINGGKFEKPILIKAENPYKVRVKGVSGHRAMYVTNSENMIFSGFEFVGNKDYTGSTSGNAYLLQIELSKSIILENNIIHDSYNNDLLKLNEHCDNCEIRLNIFYNQNANGGDEHIDANSVYNTTIEGNIFFNDYKASGRQESNAAFSFVLFKSSSSQDISTASRDAIIKKNVFLNWWGKADQSYIVLGEDGKSFYEVQNVEISDNLFINNKTRETKNGDGNYYNRMSGLFTIKNAKNVTFKNNTSNGFIQHSWHAYNNDPGSFFGYVVRISKEWQNSPIIDTVKITGNSFVDYTGQMGGIASGTKAMVTNISLNGNNYYNNGKAFLDTSTRDLAIQIADDSNAAFDDPQLEDDLTKVTVPYFNEGTLHGNYAGINAARIDLIQKYGR
jgi:hypothetical protein